MNRVHQAVLIVSTLVLCWLGMMAVHELGHVVGAALTGGAVRRVVLHPLTISRTDLSHNPNPLAVVWVGPLVGVFVPALAWSAAQSLQLPGWFLLRFFAGFCLIANGAYLGVGSFERIGDAGELLRHGSASWQLGAFGLVNVPLGLLLWHRLGPFFGFSDARGEVNVTTAYGCLCAAFVVIFLSWHLGGE